MNDKLRRIERLEAAVGTPDERAQMVELVRSLEGLTFDELGRLKAIAERMEEIPEGERKSSPEFAEARRMFEGAAERESGMIRPETDAAPRL